MIWLELTLAVLVGAVIGWFTNALIRRIGHSKADQNRPIATSGSEASASGTGIRPPEVAAPISPASAQPISQDADLAGRVITHLASLGRLRNDEVGRLGFTQKGIIEGLGIRQGTLTKVLSRLESAKVVEVDRRHVQGQSHRLKVYRLTALGESVARDLRHRPSTTRE